MKSLFPFLFLIFFLGIFSAISFFFPFEEKEKITTFTFDASSTIPFTRESDGLSFSYSPLFSLEEFEESDADVLLLRHKEKEEVLQIFSYQIEGPLLKEDIENLFINQLGNIRETTTKNGIQGFLFVSFDTDRPVEEFWFIHNETAYQISVYEEYRERLRGIIDTLHFK